VLLFDDSRQTDEFRADLQSGAVRCQQVDFKTNLVFFNCQVYDSAQQRETLSFADSQSAGSLESHHNSGGLGFLRERDKNDLTSVQVIVWPQLLDFNRVPSHTPGS